MHLNKILEQIKRHQSPTAVALNKKGGNYVSFRI